MAKTKQKQAQNNTESLYFLKLVLLLVLGSFWIRISTKGGIQIPLPVGLILGLFMIQNERLKIDRKIGYAFLLIAMYVGFWSPLGLFIKL